jgi:uncharacterized membrane protein YedE/YeeE
MNNKLYLLNSRMPTKQKDNKLLRYFNWRIWSGLLLLAAAVFIFFSLNPGYPRLAIFWIFGLAFGFVLQRSQFCFVSGFSNFYIFRYGRILKAILVGIAMATVGFAIIMYRLVPDPSSGNIPVTAHVAPLGWHLVLAGIIFGTGMILAGGCIVGTLYRIGEGTIKALISLLGILIGMAFLLHTWDWWWPNYISQAPRVWLPRLIGWPGSVLLTLTVLGAFFIIVHFLESRAKPSGISSLESQANLPALASRSRLIKIMRTVFKSYWPVMLGGIILALINIIEYWAVGRPWGIVGEISSWSTGILNFLGLPPPQAITVPGT